MNFSYPFIMRPVGTTLLAIGLFLVGCVAYEFLPVASVPTVDFPVPVANGVQMPVEFDEASGTFSMSGAAWAARFDPRYCSFTTSQSCTIDTDCQPPACPTCGDSSGITCAAWPTPGSP